MLEPRILLLWDSNIVHSAGASNSTPNMRAFSGFSENCLYLVKVQKFQCKDLSVKCKLFFVYSINAPVWNSHVHNV